MVDGIGYSVQGSEATAILTFQNSGEITIPSIVTSDGTTYSVTGLLVDNARLDSLSVPSSVRYMQLLNSEVDELYLDAATGAYADNSRMDSIIYRGTGTYDIDLYWIDQGVYDLIGRDRAFNTCHSQLRPHQADGDAHGVPLDARYFHRADGLVANQSQDIFQRHGKGVLYLLERAAGKPRRRAGAHSRSYADFYLAAADAAGKCRFIADDRSDSRGD